MSVPSTPRPYCPLDGIVSFCRVGDELSSVVGGPEIPAAAKSALFQNSAWVFVSSGSA